MKLISFEVENRIFEIDGDFEAEIRGWKDEQYVIPVYDNLSAVEFINGEPVKFEPQGCSWIGHEYTVESMITEAVRQMMIQGDDYKITYLDPGLKTLLDKDFSALIHVDGGPLKVNNKAFPKSILKSDDRYDALLITSEYAYYTYEDVLLMFDSSSRMIVSDNYFAEVGYFDSVENVQNGKETLLWADPQCELEM